jgi:hypothetical protein
MQIHRGILKTARFGNLVRYRHTPYCGQLLIVFAGS